MPNNLEINKSKLPKHVGIILDGNRRWARSHELNELEGHKKGSESVKVILKTARELNIHTMSFWGFSTENWNRSDEEISRLMKLYEKFLDNHLEEALEEDMRIIHLGRKDRIPERLRRKIENAEKQSENKTSHVLNLGLDYGGQDEILRATKKIVDDIQSGKISVEDLSKEVGKYKEKYPYYLYKNYLDTGDQPYPYPDLIIRTSGEKRLSGFMPWQSCYSELYFTNVALPDFREEEFKKAITEFTHRKRRFGGNSEKYK